MFASQGLLDELEAGVDLLNQTDLSAWGAAAAEDALVGLERFEAKLAAFKARLCRKYDVEKEWAVKGAQHPGAVMATMRRVPSKTCKRPFRLGRQLEELPALLGALARGSINLQHRDRILAADNSRVHERFVADHVTFVEWAETLDWGTFEMHLVLWGHMADPDGPDPAHDRRGLDLSQSWRNEFVVNGSMGAVQGTVFATELRRLDDQLFKADWTAAKDRLGRHPHDHELGRTPRQRRIDALVLMAERSATGPEQHRKGAILASVLLGPDAARWLCEFATGTRIRPGQLGPHLDDLTFETFLYGEGMKDVSVSETRFFLEALRRATQAKDRQCFHEFCDTPAAECQTDHRIPYSKGGPTALWNGQPGCAFHNGGKGNTMPSDPDP